ncbi:ABC transporter ATP-binding protein [Paenibacillus lycopersici]|uniref:Carnitine transport ATP-binding protein OpuCA n=1 Tax=Paenibacillus lycopersici TaxID=2704462 RepID=A0A6C0FN81_9BACL|nr:ABC transporter ATP-binding protein [Paenibacillus lycopersici]QHT58548.1 ABC transporter ATP-binding protein [Paenibacillus lycopersici]
MLTTNKVTSLLQNNQAATGSGRLSSSPGLSFRGISVSYGAKKVLDRFSLDLPRGEFLSLVGNSGCGKTTLLRTISGFASIDEGEIWVNGKELGRMPTHKRNIGFVHQHYALFPHMTVFENVAFGLRERKLPRREIHARVEEYLKLVHMEAHARSYPGQLSGGMQQRIALARALAIQPDILLLDEPLSALDTNLRVALREELMELHRRFPELTIIYVTHDREEALQLSDRIALIREGKLEQLGTPEQLYDRPDSLYVARYLGIANVIPAEAAAWLEGYGSPPEAGQRFIRPEHIRNDHSANVKLAATVERCEWVGSFYRVQARAEGCGDWHLTLEWQRRTSPPAAGTILPLSFNEEDCRYVQA